MREAHLTLPELGLIAMTRAALGAGIALLLADRLATDERKALGWALTMVGVMTTLPLAAEVLGKSHPGSTLARTDLSVGGVSVCSAPLQRGSAKTA